MGMRPFALLLVLSVVGGCSASSPEQWSASRDGTAVRVQTSPFALTIVNRQGEEILRLFDGQDRYGAIAATIDDPVFEPQIVPGWDDYRANDTFFSVASNPRIVRRTDNEVTVRFSGELEATLTVRLLENRVQLQVETEELIPHDPRGRHTKASLAFHLGADEHFFGLGQRTATVDHRGWSMYNWSEEGGLGRGEGAEPGPENPFPNGVSMTNFPVPVVHSTAGYMLHIDTFYRSELHMGSEVDDAWRIAVNRNAFSVTVYADPDPMRNLDMYTEDTGRPIMPAPWVFGPRRRLSLGDMAFDQPEWQVLRERGVPTTSLDDNVHFLPDLTHVGRETELRAWVDTLHANGFKVMAYNNPYVSMTSERAAADAAFGAERDLLLTTPDGEIATAFLISGSPQDIATIDLTLPEGQAWFQSLLMRTLDFGYDGWMHDFGEYVGRDWRAGDGMHGDELHNRFPVLSAKAAYELMERERPGDFHFHVRSGFTGSQQYVPAVWNGDPEATFDPTQGLPASLFGGVNLSMSGFAYWGSDISGFKCYTDDPYDKEMYLRWAQLGAVSPIMQSQSACANVTGRRRKWTLWSDEETIEVYGDMARLHTRLQPYFLVLARQAHESGAPLMRHPFLLYPREPSAWQVRDAFFLGDALYAAPVIERGARERVVWLPPGRFLDWNEGRIHEGGQSVTVPAPLARLPLFLVENRIVPLLDPSIETLAEATEPGVVTPSRVADRLDAVAFVTDGPAAMTLEDGTVLSIEVLGEGLANATLDEVEPSAISFCASCFVRTTTTTAGRAERLQVNTAEAMESDVRLGGLRLRHRSSRPLRVRWDLFLTQP